MLDLPPEAIPNQPASRPPAIVKPHDLAEAAFPKSLREKLNLIPEDLAKLSAVEALNPLRGPGISLIYGGLAKLVGASPDPAPQQPRPADTPAPLTERMNPSFYDGAIMGADGKMYPNLLRLQDVPPVYPWGGIGGAPRPEAERIIFVNGMSTAPSMAQYNMQIIASRTGTPVIGIYNATDGEVPDVLQVMMDKANVGRNPAVDTLKRSLMHALTHGESLHLVGESHGALVISRAIGDARRSLLDSGLTESEVNERLNKIKVETYGGSAWSYPDGPRYVHYINDRDPIPFHFGLTPYGLDSRRLAEIESSLQQPGWVRNLAFIVDVLDVNYIAGLHPGRDARIVRFSQGHEQDWLQTHMVDTYLVHRKPFDEAYSRAPAKPSDFELWPAVKTAVKWLLVGLGVYWLGRMFRRVANAIARPKEGGKTATQSEDSDGES